MPPPNPCLRTLSSGATGNTLGGTADGAGNVISGNNRFGVFLSGGDTSGNLVQGNRIGTDAAGTAALGNGADGVALFSGAAQNTIGGPAAGAANLISGNGRFGILDVDNAAADNVFQGNRIGTWGTAVRASSQANSLARRRRMKSATPPSSRPTKSSGASRKRCGTTRVMIYRFALAAEREKINHHGRSRRASVDYS